MHQHVDVIGHHAPFQQPIAFSSEVKQRFLDGLGVMFLG